MTRVKQDADLVFEKQADRVTPNRTALATATAVASAIGSLPYAIFLARFQAVIPIAAFALGFVVAVVGLRGFQSLSTEKPSLGEYLLGSWAAVMGPSMAGLFGIMTYWLTKKVLQLARFVVDWAGGSFEPAADLWALRISIGIAALFMMSGSNVAADELAKKIYPATAGTRSAFYSLLVEKRRLTLMFALSIVALAVIIWLLGPSGGGFAAVLAFYLFYTGAALESIGTSEAKAPGKQRILDSVSKLCTAAGYRSTLSPRTGRSDIDPLIANVDLLALSPKLALAIEVKSGAHKSKPVEWFEASRLQTAAWALGRFLGKHQLAGEARPLLVLAGRAKAEGLHDYLARSPVAMIEIDDSEIFDEILAEPDAARLRQIAIGRFGIEEVAGYPEESQDSGEEAGR